MSLKTLTTELLALTDQSYDNYNTILPEIKARITASDLVGDQRVEIFEHTLVEEISLTTARRAYRTAIRIALGEDRVEREYVKMMAKMTAQQGRKINEKRY